MSRIAIFLIRAYQYMISPLLGPTCRFHPTCSEYSVQAFAKYGILKGGCLSVRRVLRCHPWNRGGNDPLP